MIIVFANLFAMIGHCIAGSEVLTGEKYWYYDKKGLLLSVSNRAEEVVGTYASRHGPTGFTIKQDALKDNEQKTLGYLRVLDDLVSIVTYASREVRAQEALTNLTNMTGIKLDRDAWAGWLKTNRLYLVWSERNQRFIIDEEARAKGIPSADYRKRNPWKTKP